MEHEELTGSIIGCGMKSHRVLGPGFLESIYRNALALEFTKRGLVFERERRLEVRYDGVRIGTFSTDFIVGGLVVVEVKAVETLTKQHEKQVVNYLAATGLDIGLLLNFGASELQFKRKTRLYQPRADRNFQPRESTRQDSQDVQDGQDTAPAPLAAVRIEQ